MSNFTVDTINVLTQETAEERKKIISDLHYEIDIKIHEKKPTYEAHVRIAFTHTRGNPEFLKIDFVTSLIHSITIKGKEIKNYSKGNYAIYIPTEILSDGFTEIVVTYTNNFDNTGSGFHKFTDPEDGAEYMHTDFEPYDAHRLFPCFDQPDLKATYHLTITGPEKWTYIHNTPIETRTSDGTMVTISYKKTPRFSTYLFALVIGPYDCWEDRYKSIPLRVFCRKSLSKFMDQKNIFSVTQESFTFLEEYFALPYPYEKYDQVFVPEFNFGAMENVGCVTFSERYIFRHTMLYSEHLSRANTIAHEMVHMWFGDLVTMKWWNDLWLNESFADYLSYYALSHGQLFSDALQHFFVRKEWAYYQDQLSTTHPIAATARDTMEAFSNFDGISYSKGASVLRQLQYYIGDEKFRKAIQIYFTRFAEQNTTLPDFLGLMSEISGIDIERWSAQWLETTGVNTVTAAISGGSITLKQGPSLGNGCIRQHAIEYTGFGEREGEPYKTEKGKVFIESEKTETVLANPATEFCIFNTNDYGYIKVFFSDTDRAFIKKHISSIGDPFLRRIIWGSLWQMLRDNAFSPVEFLELAMASGKRERDLAILQSHIVSKIVSITTMYLSEANREKWLGPLFDWARDMLNMEGHNEEEQIIWLNLLMNCAESRPQLKYLEEILAGKKIINAITIDQDKRWAIVARLHAYDYPGSEAIIADEKKKDQSDLGIKKGFLAEVSAPTASSKGEFWKIFTEATDLSTDQLRYGMQGFQWPCQKEILRPYTERYFSDIEKIYTARDVHYSAAFGMFLFPVWDHSRSLLESVEKFLAEKKELPFLLRKELMTHADNLKRAIPIIEKQDGLRAG